VRDDGRGIDAEALRRRAAEAGLPPREDPLQYAFEPGLSTASAVTRISGRGVGMDVVRTNVEGLGGRIELRSAPGLGTTVRIRLPLTLAIIPGVVVQGGGRTFVLPRRHVRELLRVHDRGSPFYPVRGAMLPVVRLAEALGLPPAGSDGALAVVETEGRRFGLFVDRILDTQDVVVKPLGDPLRGLPVYGGATTLVDGAVALILDVGGVAEHAGIEPTCEEPTEPAPPPEAGSTKLLLAEDLDGDRVLLPLERVERIEEVWADSLRSEDGAWSFSWRGEDVPLRFLGEVEGVGETERVVLAVVRAGGRRRAIALGRVRDVVRTSALGRTLVIRGEAARLVDVEEVTS
jgi:two-component system chemotaxis sensor kinase CheA